MDNDNEATDDLGDGSRLPLTKAMSQFVLSYYYFLPLVSLARSRRLFPFALPQTARRSSRDLPATRRDGSFHHEDRSSLSGHAFHGSGHETGESSRRFRPHLSFPLPRLFFEH